MATALRSTHGHTVQLHGHHGGHMNHSHNHSHSRRSRLTCASSRDVRELFPADSLEWSADDAISTIEAARAAAPPDYFYLYDDLPLRPATSPKGAMNFTIAATLAAFERCGTPQLKYHYGGDYHFLRQLVDHPWRVRDPAQASIFVIPSTVCHQMPKGHGGQRRIQFCSGLVAMKEVMDAIGKTPSWREFPERHVYVSLDWETPQVPMPSNTSTEAPAVKVKPRWMRAFIESTSGAPNVDLDIWTHLLHMRERDGRLHVCKQDSRHLRMERLAAASTGAPIPRPVGLFSAPYVDNGVGLRAANLSAQWAEEAQSTFAPSRRRDIRFFFGGRTSTTIGPGRRQCGYYPRWWLMNEWTRQQRESQTAARATVASGAQAHRVLRDEVLIIDSDGDDPRALQREPPAARFCAINTTTTTNTAPTTDGTDGTPCLQACDQNALPNLTSGACHGRYTPRELLRRARFALCMRGDVPSSPRPYDAIRYGAIPVFVSDMIQRVGLPFQCLVPWRLMSMQVREVDFLNDADAALDNATRGLHPLAEARMRELIAHFGRDVLWRHPQSRVAENVLREAANLARRAGEAGCCPIRDEAASHLAPFHPLIPGAEGRGSYVL